MGLLFGDAFVQNLLESSATTNVSCSIMLRLRACSKTFFYEGNRAILNHVAMRAIQSGTFRAEQLVAILVACSTNGDGNSNSRVRIIKALRNLAGGAMRVFSRTIELAIKWKRDSLLKKAAEIYFVGKHEQELKSSDFYGFLLQAHQLANTDVSRALIQGALGSVQSHHPDEVWPRFRALLPDSADFEDEFLEPAIKSNAHELVRVLINESGFSPDIRVLVRATERGSEQMVHTLLECRLDPDRHFGEECHTALMAACLSLDSCTPSPSVLARLDILRMLAARSKDVNNQDITGNTALTHTVKLQKQEVSAIALGILFNSPSFEWDVIQMDWLLLCAVIHDNARAASYLQGCGSRLGERHIRLCVARVLHQPERENPIYDGVPAPVLEGLKGHSTSSVFAALQGYAGLAVVDVKSSAKAQRAILHALLCCDEFQPDRFPMASPVSAGAPSSWHPGAARVEMTALHAAVLCAQPEVVAGLLEGGASPTARGAEGTCCLQIALRALLRKADSRSAAVPQRQLVVLEQLLKASSAAARIEFFRRNVDGRAAGTGLPLTLASCVASQEVVEALLEYVVEEAAVENALETLLRENGRGGVGRPCVLGSLMAWAVDSPGKLEEGRICALIDRAIMACGHAHCSPLLAAMTILFHGNGAGGFPHWNVPQRNALVRVFRAFVHHARDRLGAEDFHEQCLNLPDERGRRPIEVALDRDEIPGEVFEVLAAAGASFRVGLRQNVLLKRLEWLEAFEYAEWRLCEAEYDFAFISVEEDTGREAVQLLALFAEDTSSSSRTDYRFEMDNLSSGRTLSGNWVLNKELRVIELIAATDDEEVTEVSLPLQLLCGCASCTHVDKEGVEKSIWHDGERRWRLRRDPDRLPAFVEECLCVAKELRVCCQATTELTRTRTHLIECLHFLMAADSNAAEVLPEQEQQRAELLCLSCRLRLWPLVDYLVHRGAGPYLPSGESVLFRALVSGAPTDVLRSLAVNTRVAQTVRCERGPDGGPENPQDPFDWVVGAIMDSMDEDYPTLWMIGSIRGQDLVELLELVLEAVALAGTALSAAGVDDDGCAEQSTAEERVARVLQNVLQDLVNWHLRAYTASVHVCSSSSKVRVIGLLLLHYFPPNFVLSCGTSALNVAITLGMWGTACSLVHRAGAHSISREQPTKLIDIADEIGRRPLLRACEAAARLGESCDNDSELRAVERLVQALAVAGASDIPDEEGRTALWIAVEAGCAAVVEVMLQHLPSWDKARPTPQWRSGWGSRLKMSAEESSLGPALYQMFRDDPRALSAVVDLALLKGMPPEEMLQPALQRKDAATLRTLAHACALSRSRGSCSSFGRVVRERLEAAAAADAGGEEDSVLWALIGPGECAKGKGRADSLEAAYLADQESSPSRVTPLAVAVQRSHLAAVQALLQSSAVRAAVDAGDVLAWTPLHRACALHSPERAQLVDALLSHGANPNGSTTLGLSPLHVACRSPALPSTLHIVSALLAAGALPDAPDFDGCTPLMCACRHGQAAVVDALLQGGASEASLDSRGRSAQSWLAAARSPPEATRRQISDALLTAQQKRRADASERRGGGAAAGGGNEQRSSQGSSRQCCDGESETEGQGARRTGEEGQRAAETSRKRAPSWLLAALPAKRRLVTITPALQLPGESRCVGAQPESPGVSVSGGAEDCALQAGLKAARAREWFRWARAVGGQGAWVLRSALLAVSSELGKERVEWAESRRALGGAAEQGVLEVAVTALKTHRKVPGLVIAALGALQSVCRAQEAGKRLLGMGWAPLAVMASHLGDAQVQRTGLGLWTALYDVDGDRKLLLEQFDEYCNTLVLPALRRDATGEWCRVVGDAASLVDRRSKEGRRTLHVVLRAMPLVLGAMERADDAPNEALQFYGCRALVKMHGWLSDRRNAIEAAMQRTVQSHPNSDRIRAQRQEFKRQHTQAQRHQQQHGRRRR